MEVTANAFFQRAAVERQLRFVYADGMSGVLRLTTILGWDYYSERCLEYLSGGNMKAVRIYKWMYIVAVLIGPFLTVSAVWTLADIFNGLMAIPNLIALVALNGVIVAETRSYFKRLDSGRIQD